MRIPNRLKIRRSYWQVKMDARIEETEDAIGLCVRSSKRIILSPNQTRNELEETFLHEILHAAFPTELVGPKTEEKIVEKMSKVLLQILSDNKLF